VADLITDFGVKIGGARKDMGRGNILPSDIPAMSQEEKKHWLRKEMIWPVPDYEAMVTRGVHRPVVISIKAIRDSLPDCGDKSMEAQARYVAYLNELRDCERITTVNDFRAWLQSPERTGATLTDKNSRIPDTSPLNDFEYRGRSDHYDALWAVNSYLKSASQAILPDNARPYRYATAFAFMKRNEDWPMKNAAWQQWARRREVGVFQLRGEEDGWVVGKNPEYYDYQLGVGEDGKELRLSDCLWRAPKTRTVFKTEDEANTALKAAIEKILGARKQAAIAERKQQKARAEGAAATPPAAASTERNWVEPDATVTGNQFLKEFGFRGGEFGHWVNQKQRQQVLDLGYNALRDLADIMGVPTVTLAHGRTLRDGSLDNNSLGIGFGSRGKGGINAAAAHFESTYNVINLTKPNGAGCLAHEWAHSLDFAARKLAAEIQAEPGAKIRLVHNPDTDGHQAFLSDYSVFCTPGSEVRSVEQDAILALGEAMNGIVSVVSTDQEVIAERQRRYRSAVSGYSSWVNSAIALWRGGNPSASEAQKKSFNEELGELTAPIIQGQASYDNTSKLREFLERTLKGAKAQTIQQLTHAWPSSLRAAAEAMGKPTIDEKERTRRATVYLDACRKVDGSKKPYYATRIEMFARAFEAWVHDRLTAEGRTSNYLIRGTAGEAYPQGDERKRTNALVDYAVQKWAALMRSRALGIKEAVALRQACAVMDDPEEGVVTPLPAPAEGRENKAAAK
jgi:hypothetical protein